MFACCKAPRVVEDDEALQLQQQKHQDSGVPAKGANGVAENWGRQVQAAQPGSSQASSQEEEEALESRRKSGRDTTSSSKQCTLGRWLPPLGRGRKGGLGQVAPEPSLQHDSDVLLSDQAAAAAAVATGGSAGASSSKQSGNQSSFQQNQHQSRPPGFVTPSDSFPQQSSILSRTASRANSNTGAQNRDMTAEELKSLGFTLHTCKTTERSKLKSQPVSVMALEAVEDAFLPRGRPRNNLVPLHVNTACRVYFGIGGHGEYGQVMSKLLKRDTLLTFAIQKALRNLKRGNPAAVSHVTPDPAGQTSSLLGMRITPCLWKTQDNKPSFKGRQSSGCDEELLLPALAIEHNVPYDPAEVVPRLMRDYAVLSHVPAILTLIDFQGKVLYQNASSLTYMGDLLRVKYDRQLSDGLLRVLFMYDLQNLDQMLEDVLAGEEWRGVIQVPGSLRRYLAASAGAAVGSTSFDDSRGKDHASSSGADAHIGPSLDGRQPRPSGFGVAGTGSDLDLEFQIVDKSNHPAFVSSGAQGHEPRPRRPYMLAPPPIFPQTPQVNSTALQQQQQQQDAGFLDGPPIPNHLHQHGFSSATNQAMSQRNDAWDHVGGMGRASLSEGGSGENSHAYAHSSAHAECGHPGTQLPHHQQQFQQRKFMTLLERQGHLGHASSLQHSRANSRPHAGATSSGTLSGHFDPHLAGTDIFHVGHRPPSNTSLTTASHADLHPNSSNTSGHDPALPHLDSLPQSGFYSNHSGTSGPIHPPPLYQQQQQLHLLQRTGSEALTAAGSDGGGGGGALHGLSNSQEAVLPQGPGAQLLLEPVEEDEGAYDEMQACFHEVHAMSLLDPVLDKQVIMLVQTDVTARVELENKLADLTDAQLSMLEQLFPRHIIEYMLARVPNKGDRNLRDLANMHEQVMVLFCDVVGFTSMSKEVEPSEVMHFLNELYESFDKLVDEYDMYKLDIVGDCYIVVAGLIKEDQDGFVCVDEMDDGEVTSNAVRIMQFAKAVLRESQPVLMPHNHEPVQLRIGIHTGPLVSGLVGAKMPKFTLFGDTMNTASRMETCCKPGCVHVSDAFAQLLPHEEWGSTGGVQVKGKGMMQTYLWEPNPDTQQDFSGLDAAMAASALQQRSHNRSSNNSVRSHVTSRTTRSRFTSFSRRQSAAGGLDDSNDDTPNHPLLTILTNIRRDGSGGHEDEGFAVEGGGRSFVSLHGRSSQLRPLQRRRSSNGYNAHRRSSDNPRRRSSNGDPPNVQAALSKPIPSGTSTSNGGSGRTSKRNSEGYSGLQKRSSSQLEDAHQLAAATAALTGHALPKTTSASLQPSLSATVGGPGGLSGNSRTVSSGELRKSGEAKSGKGSSWGGMAFWEGREIAPSRPSSRSKQINRSTTQRLLGRQPSPTKCSSHEGQNVLVAAAAAINTACSSSSNSNNRASPFQSSTAAASRRSSEGYERRTPVMLDRASRLSEASSSGHSLARGSKSNLAPLAGHASTSARVRVGEGSAHGGTAGSAGGAVGGGVGSGEGSSKARSAANSRTQSGQLPSTQLRGVLKTNSINIANLGSKEVPPLLVGGSASGGVGSEGSSPTALGRSLLRGNTSSVRFRDTEVWDQPSQSRLQRQQQQQQQPESKSPQQHCEQQHLQQEEPEEHQHQHEPHQPSPLQQQQPSHLVPPHPHPPDPHLPETLPPLPQQPQQQQHSPPQQAALPHVSEKGWLEEQRAAAIGSGDNEGEGGAGRRFSFAGDGEDGVLTLEGGGVVPRPPPAPPPTLPVQTQGPAGGQSVQTSLAAVEEDDEQLVL